MLMKTHFTKHVTSCIVGCCASSMCCAYTSDQHATAHATTTPSHTNAAGADHACCWPCLCVQLYAIDVQREILAELGTRPDLIIGEQRACLGTAICERRNSNPLQALMLQTTRLELSHRKLDKHAALVATAVYLQSCQIPCIERDVLQLNYHVHDTGADV